jgi:hypothetical protein
MTVFQIRALLALCVPNYIKTTIRILDGRSDCRMQASVRLFRRNSMSFSVFVCLFVFLVLQPIVVVFSQPGSGL